MLKIVCLFAGILFLFSCETTMKFNPKVIEIKDNWKLHRISNGDSWLAKVPGCVHLDLLENKVIEDPFFRTNEKKQQWIDKEDWVYETEFDFDQNFLEEEFIELHFKGLDTYADVYLNDSLILKANNMFREWKLECKNLLNNGKNKLKIYFHSPIRIGLGLLEKNGYPLPASNDQSEQGELGDKRVSPFTRKAPYHYGWDWGPRFVSSGIWRPVFLKAWSAVKIENIQFIQEKISEEEAIVLAKLFVKSMGEQKFIVKLRDKESGKEYYSSEVSVPDGESALDMPFTIKNPKLWWTNGLGEAHLYKLEALIIKEGKIHDQMEDQIGLRTIEIVQEPDQYGKSFYFKVNGVPVFMKGANHIPNDIFLTRVSPEIYEREIQDAAESSMNMLRVWGGGIYEDDVFYDLCDKYGILVWQDFMFACSMYPGNPEFVESVGYEARDNIIRLRNHPSIALWCGNNEIDVAWHEYGPGGWGWKEQYTPDQRKEIWAAYEKVFHGILPEMIGKYDSLRFYWPSSPMAGPKEHASYSTTSGDMHYWGVWHGKERFSEFQIKKARFMSEYGFQSFPEFKTVQKYALPEDYDIESEVMAAHQRSGIGNLRIREYMEWYYKKPKDFEHFLYVGQVLQGYGMKMGIEAHRRDMPYCMGTLYWQINDCWPVASWSSIDYYGNWKAMQYFVKKAFADILVSPVVENDSLKVYVVSDRLAAEKVKLSVDVLNIVSNETKPFMIETELEPNTSKVYYQIALRDMIKGNNHGELAIIVALKNGSGILSENILHLLEPKDVNFPEAIIEPVLSQEGKSIKISLKTNNFAKNVFLSFEGDHGRFSDNYFDMVPGRNYDVFYQPEKDNFDLKTGLRIISLYQSYQ